MMPSLTDVSCVLRMWNYNKSTAFTTKNIRFFYLTMVFIVEHKTFLIE
jgi:hypothetical protein